jgi:hypothetical protein
MEPKENFPEELNAKELWFKEWHFDGFGRPEDAALFVDEVLAAVRDHAGSGAHTALNDIVSSSGFADFIFQWLRSVGLADGYALTSKGKKVLQMLDDEAFYPLFGL